MSTAVIMEGYDTKLIGTLFAQPAFQKAYGKLVSEGKYQVTAPWQAGLSNGSATGQLCGLLIAGYVSERFGFRKTVISGLTIIAGLLFITFFAPNIVVLQVGQSLLGKNLNASRFLYMLNRHPRRSAGSVSDHCRRLRA